MYLQAMMLPYLFLILFSDCLATSQLAVRPAGINCKNEQQHLITVLNQNYFKTAFNGRIIIVFV